MQDFEGSAALQSQDPENAEYNPPPDDRRRGGSHVSHRSHRFMRVAFFVSASIWGFVVGGGGLAFALSLRGRPVGLEDPLLLEAAFGGLVLAIGGGVVSAVAYRETRRRSG